MSATAGFLSGQHQFVGSSAMMAAGGGKRGADRTVVLWLVSLGLHFGYDALAVHGAEAAKFSAATMDLYFAVSLAAQQAVLHARAGW